MSRWIPWIAAVVVLACAACGDGGRSEPTPCDDVSDCTAGNICTPLGECRDPTVAVASAVGTAEGAPVEVRVIKEDGSECPAREGCKELPQGSRVTFRAPAAAGYRFVGWAGPSMVCVGSAPELVISSLASDARCTARYVRRLRVTAVDAAGQGAVSARSEAPYATCERASCEVDVGSEVVVNAADGPNARFRGWSGNGCQASEATFRVTPRDSDITCSANYIDRFAVAASTFGAEGVVAVQSDSPGAQCEAARCTVDRGAAATLTAPVLAGFRFTGWSGSPTCIGSDAVLRIADIGANEACTASYVPRRTVTASSEGATPAPVVAVRSDDAFASCSAGACEIDVGGSATLVAPSAEGYRLTGWSGERCEGQVASAVTVRDIVENTACVAQYVQGIAVSGAVLGAVGEVTASSAGSFARCARGSCVIDVGGNVTLAAPVIEGSRFLGWEGDAGCAGQQATLTFDGVTTSKTCYARYATRYRVQGAASPNQGGSVTARSTSTAASCTGASCLVDAGGEVTLEAAPAQGQRFTGWSGGGGCTGQATRLSIDDVRANVTCTANFIARLVVGAVAAPVAGGTVSATSSSPNAVCMGASCSVDRDARVVLMATPAEGYRFSGWSECSTGSEPALALESIQRNTMCRANFERQTYTIMLQRNIAGGDVAITMPAPTCQGASCSKTVVGGTMVSIEARPFANHVFQSWSGCTGAGASRSATITVNAAATCTANFVRTFAASATALHDTLNGYAPMPADSYVVTTRSSVVDCTGAMCTVPAESSVTFSAAAANGSGWQFLRWECTGSTFTTDMSSFALAISADTPCVAYFRSPTVYFVGGEVYLDGRYVPEAGNITARSPSRWATCSGSGCSVLPNTTVTLVASAIGNSSFRNWTCGNQIYTTPEITLTATTSTIGCIANFGSAAVP